jgi:hypothetical protein
MSSRGADGIFDGERPASMGSGRRHRRHPSAAPRGEEERTASQKRKEERAVLIPLNPTSPDVYQDGFEPVQHRPTERPG